MRGIYRSRVVVQTVLGPQQATIEGEAVDMWEAATTIGRLCRERAAADEMPKGPVIVLAIECVGFISDKPIVMGPDGEPLVQNEEEGDAGMERVDNDTGDETGSETGDGG